ncbi:MAG: ATP-binding cassette domain-containing protein [Deltaproteobacteria bacterium]|nr:ATP-binding cassette domain-containing protein [Deltaproteobacteria bacterium]
MSEGNGLSVETKDIVKAYAGVNALAGVSLSINEGEFFGLLGPNGAGKTTLIRILTTLIKPTSGSARVFGFDVVKDAASVRKSIGVVTQAMTTDLDLTGREALDIYARFYGMPKAERTGRIGILLEMVGLGERADDLVAAYSGGMRRRLEIARGLIHKPRILILDEPTIGLDPQSRIVVWELLKEFRKQDRLTILLTTHYMEEAETLSDRIAIIDKGSIVAQGTVDGLKRALPQKDVVELTVAPDAVEKAVARIKALEYPSPVVIDSTLIISVDTGAQAMPELISALNSAGVNIKKAVLKQLTLEDVFIHFTGRPIREEEAKKVSFFLGAGVPAKWGR